jgi:hypothetical protein
MDLGLVGWDEMAIHVYVVEDEFKELRSVKFWVKGPRWFFGSVLRMVMETPMRKERVMADGSRKWPASG